MRPMATSGKFPRRLRPLWTGVVACLVAVGWTGSASAFEHYPGEILAYLEKTQDKGMPACPPTCLLCHKSPNGGAASIRGDGFVTALGYAGESIMPFVFLDGVMPIERALVALETNPCATLGDMTPTPCDSDKDMVEDMAEVRLGTDPNGPGEASDCPKYGCGASSVAPGRTVTRHLDGTLSVAALGLFALLVRRRRFAAR